MHLPCAPTKEQEKLDCYTPAYRKTWGEIWENPEQRALLILRHIHYVRESIESYLCGNRLSIIELVHLRNITHDVLLECIHFDALPWTSTRSKNDYQASTEIMTRWFFECMNIDINLLHTYSGPHDPRIETYLMRKHWESQFPFLKEENPSTEIE